MDWEPLFAIIVFGAIAYATIWGWYREGMPPRTRGEEVTKPGWPREDRPPTATPRSPRGLRALPYEDYLQTPHWKGRREDKLRAVGHRCQVCNRGVGTLDVHHRTYERLSQELDEDLTVLCRACHSIFHEQRHRPVGQVRRTMTPEAPTTTPTSATVPPTRPNLVVGDTATSSSGDTYTLHACEVHHEEGTDLLALDTEGCAAPSQEGPRKLFNAFWFQLQMTDNTRLSQPTLPSSRPYDRLEHGVLLPGDCVRGWVFFQIPEGKKPKFVVFSNHYGSGYPEDWLIKWDIQRHW